MNRHTMVRRTATAALAGLWVAVNCWGQTAPPATTDSLAARLPLDSAITLGKLDNGITYYVRVNKKPEHRAELRLVVNAGSILEDDDQQGLAHFAEHMAFNGTRDFKKQELVNYLESVGVRFGPDLNAYTSFDETVFMLQIPTDTPAIVEKGIDILENWAHLVSYDDTEIDKERGVVIEEWRLGRGADARMRDKQFPVIFDHSHYAQRLPIGKKDILESFPHNALRRFYKDWYRPDLMAVVAVGDFDKAEIEALIRKHFSAIPPGTAERPRVTYPVPDHKNTLYTIVTDPEATRSDVGIYFMQSVEPDSTLRDYRQSIVEDLYNSMLNDRFSEMLQQPDPPFLVAFSTQGRIVKSKDVYLLNATTRENGLERGLAALLTEAYRVQRFGFTESEFNRKKKELMRGMERAYDERDKTESSRFAAEYNRNFLVHEPSPGIGYEYGLYNRFLPGITLDEVNDLASRWITDTNRVVAVEEPRKDDVRVPTSAELDRIIDSVGRQAILPHEDNVPTQPLVPAPPAPGTIADEKEEKDLGITEWMLSNGVRVILKPTDFKNDEVLFTAFAPGGTSLSPDTDYIAAATAPAVIKEGGAGNFDKIALQKALAGKLVDVTPYIGEVEEALTGSSSPQDIETMFQLIYLYLRAPRMDSTAFASYIARMKGMLENRSARPEAAFEDTVRVTMSQHNFRRRPFTVALLQEMNLRKSLAFYRDRFSDAGNFTFIFVGNFAVKRIQPWVLIYLGGLPSLDKHATWKDLGIEPPRGIIEKTVTKGIDPKSQVRIIYSGPFAWSQENRNALNALASVLRMKLRESLREEKGGTYGVRVNADPAHYPRAEYGVAISFGCAPERVEELTKTAFQVIDSLRNFGPAESYIVKVKETMRRESEVNLKRNGFWLGSLQFVYDNGEDPMEILDTPRMIDAISSALVQHAATQYLDGHNFVKVVQYPERKKK